MKFAKLLSKVFTGLPSLSSLFTDANPFCQHTPSAPTCYLLITLLSDGDAKTNKTLSLPQVVHSDFREGGV